MARALFETALQRQANPGLRLQLGAQQQEAAHRFLCDVGELRLGRQIDQGGGARPRDGGKQGTAARLAVGGSDRIDHLRRVRRIARRRDHAGAARDRRRQRGAVAQRLEIEIAQLRRLDDGQRLAALGDLDAGGDRQRLEADQGANDGRLRIAQHACRHLGVREVDGHQRRAVDLAGRHVGSGKSRGGVALQHPAGRIGAAGKRFGELRLANHGAGALSFARQHQRVGHRRGDRRIGIAAGVAHHLVQALRLAHGGELLDLEHEQAGRRTAVRRRWRELAHQDLELQVAQGAAARRIGQRRDQPLGGCQGGPGPGVRRHPSRGRRQEAGGSVIEIGNLRVDRCRHQHREHRGRGGEASARSVHWGRGPRSAARADGARSRQVPPRRQPGGRRQ